MSSQLPDWMRDPKPPERTTVTWEIGQAMRRTRIWRWGSAFARWWSNRYRITRRFPRTTAVLAFFTSVAVTVYIYYWIMYLFAQAD
ncbi:MAG TPA: hypothetical protein VF062_23900 [Candidatus Limnocylindrales bacterium]